MDNNQKFHECDKCTRESKVLYWDRRYGFVCYECACTPIVRETTETEK